MHCTLRWPKSCARKHVSRWVSTHPKLVQQQQRRATRLVLITLSHAAHARPQNLANQSHTPHPPGSPVRCRAPIPKIPEPNQCVRGHDLRRPARRPPASHHARTPDKYATHPQPHSPSPSPQPRRRSTTLSRLLGFRRHDCGGVGQGRRREPGHARRL
jgi:hypothetical protein